MSRCGNNCDNCQNKQAMIATPANKPELAKILVQFIEKFNLPMPENNRELVMLSRFIKAVEPYITLPYPSPTNNAVGWVLTWDNDDVYIDLEGEFEQSNYTMFKRFRSTKKEEWDVFMIGEVTPEWIQKHFAEYLLPTFKKT